MKSAIVFCGIAFARFLSVSAGVPDYRVFVDGRQVDLVEAPKPTKYWKGQMYDQFAQPYWAALIDAKGEVEIRVESDVQDLKSARFLPELPGLTEEERGGKSLTFRAKNVLKVLRLLRLDRTANQFREPKFDMSVIPSFFLADFSQRMSFQEALG